MELFLHQNCQAKSNFIVPKWCLHNPSTSQDTHSGCDGGVIPGQLSQCTIYYYRHTRPICIYLKIDLHRLICVYLYIDHIHMTVPSKQHAQEMLEIANHAHRDLKFELETPDNESFLQVLDTKIRITDDGCLKHKYYTKKATKGLILPYSSHHSKRLLHNIARNQLSRMDKLSDDRHRAAYQIRML